LSTQMDNHALALECIKRLDQQGDLFELLDDDVEILYPKWGIARGKEESGRMLQDFGLYLGAMKHDYDSFNFIVQGDSVCVEGVSSGTLANGMSWQPNGDEVGRFCTVFTMHSGKIKRMFVYLDPDYCDQTKSLYAWKESR